MTTELAGVRVGRPIAGSAIFGGYGEPPYEKQSPYPKISCITPLNKALTLYVRFARAAILKIGSSAGSMFKGTPRARFTGTLLSRIWRAYR